MACWGNDGYGQATPSRGEFASISAGYAHTCGVRANGSLACWGEDEYFGRATPPSGKFTSVSTGGFHTCAVKTNGLVVCWGDGSYGKASSRAPEFTVGERWTLPHLWD